MLIGVYTTYMQKNNNFLLVVCYELAFWLATQSNSIMHQYVNKFTFNYVNKFTFNYASIMSINLHSIMHQLCNSKITKKIIN